MTISNGYLADANEVGPQIRAILRNMIYMDKLHPLDVEITGTTILNGTLKQIGSFYPIHMTGIEDSFYVDGFGNSTLQGTNAGRMNSMVTATNFTAGGFAYWTTTNGATLISLPWTVSSKSYATTILDYDIYQTYDECSGASIDAGLWSTDGSSAGSPGGSVSETEGGGYITLSAVSPIAAGSSTSSVRSLNALLTTTMKKCAFVANTTGSATLQGGSSFNIYAVTTTGTSSTKIYGTDMAVHGDAYFEVVFNPDAQMLYVYRNGMLMSRVSFTATTNIALKFDAVGTYSNTACTGVVNINFVRTLKTSPSSSIATAVSYNNGVNYTTTTDGTETSIGVAGTQMKLKQTATIVGSEYIHVRGNGIFMR